MGLSQYATGASVKTLADLKDRIIRETNRDDLTDATSTDPTAAYAGSLTLAIDGAIDDFKDTRFSFNEGIQTTVLTPGSNTSAWPTTPYAFLSIDRLSMNYGGAGSSRYELRVESLARLDQLAGYVTSVGQPTVYAVLGDTIRVWPTPNFAYPLTWVGIIDLGMPINDADSNPWTDEAQDLIAAQARFRLMRDYFRDTDGAATARAAVLAALQKLTNRAARQLGTGRVRAAW